MGKPDVHAFIAFFLTISSLDFHNSWFYFEVRNVSSKGLFEPCVL